MAVLCMGKNINRHFSRNFEFFWYYFLSLTENAFIMLSQMWILDYLFMDTNLAHPKNLSGAKFIQGEWRDFHRARALFPAGVEFHDLSCVFVCFLVEFDLVFVFSVLSCRILDCASLFIYVHEHNRLCFPMFTVETAVFDCICWLSSSRDRKGQSYPVEYSLDWIGGRVLRVHDP